MASGKRIAKKAVKVAPAKKAKRAPAKKAPAKKAAAKPAKKSAARKPKTKSSDGRYLPRDMNEHGFVKGSDSEKIVNILLEGGTDRLDINEKVLKAIGGKTSGGKAPNVSSLVANLVSRLKAKGYTVESSWRLVPATSASKAAATRAKNKAATKAGTTKAKPRKASGPAKKAPARKKAARKPRK